MSNKLDPDQDRHSVGPDLGPNCLQRLSGCQQTIKVATNKERVNPYPANIFVLKMPSAYYVSCIYSCAIQNTFTMQGNKNADRPTDKSVYWKTTFFISHPNICLN